MKRIIRSTLASLSVFTVALAAWGASGYSSGIPAKAWAGFTGGDVYVTGLPNTASCSSSTIRFSSSWTDAESIERLATAALLSGKTLECYVDGCTGTYQKGFDCKLVR